MVNSPTACDLVPKFVHENADLLKEILFSNKYNFEHVVGPGELQRSLPS